LSIVDPVINIHLRCHTMNSDIFIRQAGDRRTAIH